MNTNKWILNNWLLLAVAAIVGYWLWQNKNYPVGYKAGSAAAEAEDAAAAYAP